MDSLFNVLVACGLLFIMCGVGGCFVALALFIWRAAKELHDN